MDESKREAFLRLAAKRTEAVLDRIRILAHCSNRYAYDCTEEDVRKIFDAIDQQLTVARARFEGERKKPFTLG